tara:strand:+ start:1037 stop:1522 length:486 start_codon:yes stop_codon:yes gene_type:complete
MKITNNSHMQRFEELQELLKEFCPFAKERMGFSNYPSNITFQDDAENASNMLGKTAYYDPASSSITVFVTNRHPKDILRSVSHELVHHAQNERGDFDQDMEMGEGYAQKNEYLREMEKEAYTEGNLVLRDWEDGRRLESLKEVFNRRGVRLYDRLMKRLLR